MVNIHLVGVAAFFYPSTRYRVHCYIVEAVVVWIILDLNVTRNKNTEKL